MSERNTDVENFPTFEKPSPHDRSNKSTRLKKVLVIDDEPLIVKMVKSRLEANHLQVVTAQNGFEALKVAEEEQPDLIISDILMPGMDGFTFINALQKNEVLKHIPVIVLSAVQESRNQQHIRGVSEFISKPFDAQELVEKVNRVLGNH